MPLRIRHTYWNIPCTQRTLGAGLAILAKVLAAAGPGTSHAAGPSLADPATWREHKVGTYGGRTVLLTVEVPPAGPPPARPHPLVLHRREHTFRPDRGRAAHAYRVYGYVPFRSQAYTSYRQTRSLSDRAELLRAHLRHHLDELAARLDFPAGVPVELHELRPRRERSLRLGGTPQTGFDLDFRTNVFIPEFLGLGRGAGVGMGVVRRSG